MFAAVRGARLWYGIDGAGLVPEGRAMRERPVAMLVHGGPGGDHPGFKPSMKPAVGTDAARLFRSSRPGPVRIPAGPAKYTLDENVEDMEALRQHLGLGPIVSIGTSYGGMVAMAHAARYPAAVSHLLLIVTNVHGPVHRKAQQTLEERGTAMQRRVCEMLWDGGFRSTDELRRFYDVMGPLYARKHDPAAAEVGRRRATYAPEPLNRAFGPLGFLRRFDLRPELGRIAAPTLILAGRHDWICPPGFPRRSTS